MHHHQALQSKKRGVRCHSHSILMLLAGFVFLVLTTKPASAIPSFADQTGQPCAACHFGSLGPALTPMGRLFKLNGYVWDGGDSTLPHVSAMLQGYLIHTQKDQPGGAAQHFSENDNASLGQASLFYGGKILDHMGAFFQATYDGVERRTSWDNLDIRYADDAKFGSVNSVLGVSINNNPTVQDLWNSTPAWGEPFSGSALAPSPAAAPLIAGGLAQQVIGASAYGLWDGWLYTEVGAYGRMSNRAQEIVGLHPAGETQITGLAPYWRLAVQKQSGAHYVSLGTFGLAADTYPGQDSTAGKDRSIDIGIDATYDYLGNENNNLSLYASLIDEHQRLGASSSLGGASNGSNRLHALNLTSAYTYLQTYTFTLGYFNSWGTADAVLYSGSLNGSPDSNGYNAEIDYTPFGKEDSAYGNHINLRLGLQYTGYLKFDGARHNYDGSGRNAADNNTLALVTWLLF